jgi:hypothetical protein
MPGYQFRSRAAAASPSPAAEFARYLLDDRGSAIGGECSRSFDVLLYSRYKYGSATAAGVLARALGTAFLARYRELVARPRLLVPVPSCADRGPRTRGAVHGHAQRRADPVPASARSPGAD